MEQDCVLTKDPIFKNGRNYVFLVNVKVGTAFYYDYLVQKNGGRDILIWNTATDSDGSALDGVVAIYLAQPEYSLLIQEMFIHEERK